jgi:hypothetical protein
MLLSDIYKVPIAISLGLIAAIITASIIASLLWPGKASDVDLGPKYKDSA